MTEQRGYDPNRRKRLVVAIVLVVLMLVPVLSVLVVIADAVFGVAGASSFGT